MIIFRILAITIVSFISLGISVAQAATEPRIAIWDPVKGTTESRFHLDLAAVEQLASWLKDSNAIVSRLTAAQIADHAAFSAKEFDAIIFIGNAFPRADIAALKQFADEGGVLISLAADVPFLIAIEPGADGLWTMSPREPVFAWQTSEILNHIGLQYIFDPARHDQGVIHTSTSLFKQYLPEALDFRGKLSSRWIVPLNKKGQNGEIYPLIRSQRRDQVDVPPQLFVVRNNQRAAIVATGDFYTSDLRTRLWPLGRKTVSALARMARDLHEHKLEFKPEMLVQIPQDISTLSPGVLDRIPTGSVKPEDAQALVRWGSFDGSGAEFGPALAAGQTLSVPLSAPAAKIPAALEPGATMQMALPTLATGPIYLRIRGAYLANDAAIKAQIGNEVILNESFVYMDTRGPGNFSRSLSGMPVEFTRIVFVPPTARGNVLLLANPGKTTMYFDALQIEKPTLPPRERMIGLGAPAGKLQSPELMAQLTGLRMSLRTQFIGKPDDPNRFAKVDELFNRVAAFNPHVEPILEGTPAWAAISSARLEDAQKAKRPTTVPPDPQKYAEIVEQLVRRYGDRISTYEIWNEADITQFYRGSSEEYITLFKTIVPIIRKLAPTAHIMLTGMAGYHEDFIRKMSEAGVLDSVDMVAFHPYAGKSPGWDLAYGLVEGCLLSQGCGKEIYCNEGGFPSVNAEWFVPPPQMTPQTQYNLLNLATARLLANGVAKLSVFNAGGDGNPYGLFDRGGKPLPAFAVIADYAKLGLNDARRLDISMTQADGSAIQGIYAAAATHKDGSVTVVLNPVGCPALTPVDNPTQEFNGGTPWTCFYGEAKYNGNKVTITPAPEKKYAGFYRAITLNANAFSQLEVVASGADADWELLFKHADNTTTAIAPRQGAGTFRANIRQLLKDGASQVVEVSFRVYKPTTLEAVRFLPDPNGIPALKPVVVRLSLPLSKPFAAMQATMSVGDKETPLELKLHEAAGQNWAELAIPVQSRAVIKLRPQN